jgi:hypothetical protein
MRKTSIAIVATILAIALYFALAWGSAGVQAFTSSNLGLEDVWRSQTIFVLGHVFNFGPLGLVKLAAFLAGVKLVAAAFCGLHAFNLARGHPRSELLEGALIIIAAVAVAGCVSGLWSHSDELFRESVVDLALATVGIALCMVERALKAAPVLPEVA